MFSALTPTTANSGHNVTFITEPQPKRALELPCKNVDLQTGGYWSCVRRENGGYFPVSIQGDTPAANALRSGKPGWFFTIPYPDVGVRWMLSGADKLNGAVINLNPSCFGEVYWIGGPVGQDFMAFAVWLPYSRWVSPTRETAPRLPIVVHFRPNYDLGTYGYGEAAAGAAAQGVPVVLARDLEQIQPFLAAAWYYLLGPIAFVQQMLAVRRLAALVVPIPPPTTNRPILHPDAFFKDFKAIILDVVNQARQIADKVGAGRIELREDYFILTANSHGGLYLMKAARMLVRPPLVREICMFDTDSGDMHEAKETMGRLGVVRRLYVAQTGKRGRLFTGGQGNQYERQNNDWSVADISGIPSAGTNLHDFCGRFCFSQAAALSGGMVPVVDPQGLLDKTFADPQSVQVQQCWPDRREFWKKL